jgi:hypothetical protein
MFQSLCIALLLTCCVVSAQNEKLVFGTVLVQGVYDIQEPLTTFQEDVAATVYASRPREVAALIEEAASYAH